MNVSNKCKTHVQLNSVGEIIIFRALVKFFARYFNTTYKLKNKFHEFNVISQLDTCRQAFC